MKKNINILFLMAAMIVALVSCTRDFSEINTNPNSPTEAQPALLLRKVLFDYTEQMSYEGFVAGNLLGQYFTAIDFNLFDRHALSSPQYGGNPWPFMYANLRDVQIMLDKAAESPAFAVYEGPALVMKSFIAANLTDLYGDAPYSRAAVGKSQALYNPTYDKQEAIYQGENGILASLEKAVAVMQAYKGTAKLEGDLLYNGNMTNWIRFANSLRIKYLLRISDRTDVKSQLQAILNTNLFMQENSQNAVFSFSASQPNNFRMTTARVGDYNLFVLSETAEEILKKYQDPRLALFFRPTAANAANYKGLRNGPDASQLSITLDNFSLTGRIFREDGAKYRGNYLTAWETNFLLAEAAARQLIPADAKALYEKAVQQSFEYWNVTMPTNHLTTTAAYASEKGLEHIATQKWIASIGNGYEGWIEYRRTGFPVLKPVTASLNNGLIPVRMNYPTDEEALNFVNFQEASKLTNGNSVNARVWWDVK